jgi:hypothetical protein
MKLKFIEDALVGIKFRWMLGVEKMGPGDEKGEKIEEEEEEICWETSGKSGYEQRFP